MGTKIRKQEALDYHECKPAGKIQVIPTKPVSTQHDLALAYSPGVAEPCLAIYENPEDVYKYTAKGNLVGVISNGTAVLGLGNIGPEASKPVMEGKGVLFKKFAGIDVFDIEINEEDPDKFIQIVKSLEPTFGGINLEDIKAPESFKIEQTLREQMNIPIMHDDQHGTAIISSAALLSALEVTETLADAMKGADMFLGLSIADVVTPDMLKSMAKDPIVFALANPDPEIPYDVAMKTRDDVIMATGRSDHPNQVNNVLGFPYIFRGALDVRSSAINEEMKLAAVEAIAKLAKEQVPDMVLKAYDQTSIKFGKEYLIPKPMDPRLITTISPAVAKAAMDSGVARVQITDWKKYEDELLERIGLDQRLISRVVNRARQHPKKVVFAEADHVNILKAAQMTMESGIGTPILMGKRLVIEGLIEENDLEVLKDCEVIDPSEHLDKVEEYATEFTKIRRRKGMTMHLARKAMLSRTYYGMMMVEK
ncbi:hypothetical protein B484DRAFT_426408, partial [Ochromonadaceae sp. CCMP2298]